MLRTSANALWSRFAPAARQHIAGAGAASASRRSFVSSPIAREEDEYEVDEHAPPLNLFGLPARYASALYTAASKAGNIPVVQAEFKTVIDAANADPKFKTFLEDPTMSKAKKIAGLTAFCDGAGFAPITKSFLCVVAENGRLAENQKIYDALEEYTLAAAGQVKATVTSAQALTPEQLKELTAKLQKHVDSGESLKVETKVDPRLVGGFTVAMGEDFFDLSLMSRIRQMEAELAKPIGA